MIEVTDLIRRFGDLNAFDAAPLRVEAAEIFGLIGSNGAGNSTLIKMLTTMLPPSGGHATLAGFDLRTQSAEFRRHIGYVPQLLSADGELTDNDNLLLSARLYLIPRAQRPKAEKCRARTAGNHRGTQPAGARVFRRHDTSLGNCAEDLAFPRLDLS